MSAAAEPIRVTCPHCERFFKVKPEGAGKTVKCPGCSRGVGVPGQNVSHARQNEPAPQQPVQKIYYVQQQPQGLSPGAAALLTLFIPGMGQLCQGRTAIGLATLIITPLCYLMLIVPGLVVHVAAIADAAMYRGRT